jgi:hypothetical protein
MFLRKNFPKMEGRASSRLPLLRDGYDGARPSTARRFDDLSRNGKFQHGNNDGYFQTRPP